MFKNLFHTAMSGLLVAMSVTAGVVFLNSNVWASGYPLGIGTRVYNVERGDYATIVAVEFNNTYVIRFDSGLYAGQTGSGWSRDSLAVLEGCANGLCVGEEVYNTSRGDFAKIVGLQTNGNFVIRFISGLYSGQSGSGWSRGDLAIERGCSPSGRFCVGNNAYNVSRGARVKIVAIQLDGRMVVRFSEGLYSGQAGSGWSEQDLAVVERPIVYQPEPPVYRPPFGPQPPVGPRPPLGPVPLAGRPVTCTTVSRGVRFTLTAPTIQQARLGVINRCDRDPRTDKVECARASQCDLY